jgi:aminoglycoside phosphotransferase (APT) family kinase protein
MRHDVLEIPARHRLGDLYRLLSEEAALTLLRESGLPLDDVQTDYLRLKPGIGALVGFQLEWTDRRGEINTIPGYVRTFAGGQAREMAGKWLRLRPTQTPLGQGVRLLPGGRSVLFLFPNDARLRGLGWIARMDKLKRILGGLEEFGARGLRVRGRRSTLVPVRYKPERRFIGSATLSLFHDDPAERLQRDVFLRFFPDARGEQIARVATVLRRRAGASLLPRPLGSLLGGRLFAEERVFGEEALTAVLDGRGDATAIAETVRRLHSSGASIGNPLPPGRVLSRISDGLASLAAVDASLSDAGHRVARRLKRLVPPEGVPAPVHGDLHLHQILMTTAGAVLVDLERAGTGDPLLDLGELLAHLMELERGQPGARDRLAAFRESLLDAYCRQEGPPETQALAFYTGSALANRALLRFRSLRPGWRERAVELLELAASITDTPSRGPVRGSEAAPESSSAFFSREAPPIGRFRWEVFYPQREGRPWPGFLEFLPEAQRLMDRRPDARPSDRIYGLYDPETGGFREVSPEEDQGLPGLARWIGRGELVSYRVGRRASLRLQPAPPAEPVYAKVLPARKARKLLARTLAAQQMLSRAEDGGFPELASLVDAEPDEGVLVFGAAPGRSLHDVLIEGSPETGEALRSAARAMARFHSTPARVLELPLLHPPMGLEAYASLAMRHFPNRAASYRSALERVSAVRPIPFGEGDRLVHGDLHDRNILLHEGRVTLLDLDMLHVGAPVEDMGNLSAHVIIRALQRGADVEGGRRDAMGLLEAYREAGGILVEATMSGVVARTLFRLGCLYLFRRRWQGITANLLEEAVRWAGCDEWRS